MALPVAYNYVIVRYLHNLSRGEFINLGILMWLPQTGEVLYQFTTDSSRARSFFKGLDVKSFSELVEMLEIRSHNAQQQLQTTGKLDGVETSPLCIYDITKHILPPSDVCIQMSNVRSGIIADPPGRVVDLCKELCE